MLPWLKTTPGNDPGHRFSNFSECKNHPHVLLNQIYEPSPKDSCVSAPKIHLGWSLRFFISKQFQDNSLLSICEVQSEYWCSREWYQRLPENRQKGESSRKYFLLNTWSMDRQHQHFLGYSKDPKSQTLMNQNLYVVTKICR